MRKESLERHGRGVWLDQVTFNHLSGGRQGMSMGGHKQI